MHTEPSFEQISSPENLLAAWQEFLRGKRSKPDVSEFLLHLMDNVLQLHRDLSAMAYVHGGYHAFNISDPKPRSIHKATVRDRLLHHAIHRVLYPFFDRKFIGDSFSCRVDKGTHRAMNRFRSFAYKVSQNNTRTCWVLKCDIRKFFASVDQDILQTILAKHLKDDQLLVLLGEVIESFYSTAPGKGLPLGNLTSQLLVNIYMNEFDQFTKHRLKAKQYVRYADDFAIFSEDRQWLESLIPRIAVFLHEKLSLTLHPKKVSIETVASGVDFLGWVHFFDHRVLRTSSKRRILKRISDNPSQETTSSYLGLLSHGNAHQLVEEVYAGLVDSKKHLLLYEPDSGMVER